MTRTQLAYTRLALLCVAWIAGEQVSFAVGASEVGFLVAAAFAAAAYVLTQDLGFGASRRSGPPKYWRGRRIDDENDKRRWH